MICLNKGTIFFIMTISKFKYICISPKNIYISN